MQCSPRGPRHYRIKKILRNFPLILLGQHCTDQNPMQCCPRASKQLCIRKIFHSMLMVYAILVLCNVVPEATSNISQEKFQAIQGMSFEQDLVMLFTYVYIRSFTSRKIYKVISSSTFYPATGQPFIRTLSKKVKLSASLAILPKPMQS